MAPAKEFNDPPGMPSLSNHKWSLFGHDRGMLRRLRSKTIVRTGTNLTRHVSEADHR